MVNQIIRRAAEYVEQLFKEKLHEDFRFHDAAHTASVRRYARMLGELQNLSEQELEIIDLAALFHDTGYTEIYTGHEEVSISIAETFLSKEGYAPAKIKQIGQCIKATKTGMHPQDNLSMVLKDADLSNLGMKTFFEHSNDLRFEWEVLCDSKYSEIEWLESNYKFLSEHRFYTAEARSLWGKRKKKNLKKMRKLIKKTTKKEMQNKSPIESRKSTQMMFKTALRNHIDLTGIADNKANMMLSINALIITIAMPLLASNINENKYLLFPAAILLLTCILSVIFATLATRPIKMLGNINLEYLKKGDSNVFFFGNFYKMSLNQYREAVDTVINDDHIIEKSIVNDLYFLGRALGSKYSQLRTCYLIFMIGMTATVLAFIISFLRSNAM
jgi:predicted metal-dependent HD superfamily phosphohydrolase